VRERESERAHTFQASYVWIFGSVSSSSSSTKSSSNGLALETTFFLNVKITSLEIVKKLYNKNLLRFNNNNNNCSNNIDTNNDLKPTSSSLSVSSYNARAIA